MHITKSIFYNAWRVSDLVRAETQSARLPRGLSKDTPAARGGAWSAAQVRALSDLAQRADPVGALGGR
jgi:hypothetical protein